MNPSGKGCNAPRYRPYFGVRLVATIEAGQELPSILRVAFVRDPRAIKDVSACHRRVGGCSCSVSSITGPRSACSPGHQGGSGRGRVN